MITRIPMDAENITFGASLSALQFAHQNKTKIVFNKAAPPFIYESSDVKEAWNLLYTKLMIDGQTVGGDSVVSTKVNDDYIFIVSKGNIVNKLEYKKLFVFSDENILGLPPIKEENIYYKVIDLLIPLSLSVPHMAHLATQDDFVSEVFFIKEGMRLRTELYVISNLKKNQLNDFNYSDTMVKFKCEDLLKKNNFEGAKNGKNKLLIKLQSIHREVIKQMDHYENTAKIKFIYGT